MDRAQIDLGFDGNYSVAKEFAGSRRLPHHAAARVTVDAA